MSGGPLPRGTVTFLFSDIEESSADAGEVLVSQTVKDLVAGSGIEFRDRGAHDLKGIPGEWRLYSVTRA